MTTTAFRPPILTRILTSRVLEMCVVNGDWLVVTEHTALDILGQRWQVTESTQGSVREWHGWRFMGGRG